MLKRKRQKFYSHLSRKHPTSFRIFIWLDKYLSLIIQCVSFTQNTEIANLKRITSLFKPHQNRCGYKKKSNPHQNMVHKKKKKIRMPFMGR